MLSVVVLTHNDAQILPQTLSSLSFCDEIIVIDDYSTDTTRNIARSYHARVYLRHLDDDFAAQRNYGLHKSKGEWVLFVDSDEIPSKDFAQEITKIATTSQLSRNDMIHGYFVKRKDYFLRTWLKHGETANIKLLRLARKGSGCWERPVHEIWNIKGKIGTLDYPLEHYPHPNVAQFLFEINRYSTVNAEFLFQQHVAIHWWDIVIYPLSKFFINYFLRFGFLDGTAGIVMAIMMSFHSYLTRAKLWQLWDQKS